MEQMENIDIKAVTAEAVSKLMNMPLEKKTGGWHRIHLCKIQFTPGMVKRMLISEIWGKCCSLMEEDDRGNGPLAVEKALAFLMRKGVAKEIIQFRKSSFRLRLDNAEYRIYKQGETDVYACPWPSEGRFKLLASGERLADFLLRFDEEIPSIVSHVPTIMATIRARELERTKNELEQEIKEKLIQSLVDQYLKPLGLSVIYHVQTGDTVVMDLRKSLSAKIIVPLDQLADKLKDAAGILDSLKVEDAG